MKSPVGTAAIADHRAVLAAADPCARALFALVRSLVDELEEAAPWDLLLAEPLDPRELRARALRLLEIVEQAPRRIARELDAVTASPAAANAAAAREEAEFYFAALHQMTASDRRLVSSALARAPDLAALSGAAGAYLAEVAADLKGKYASAMMGAAAALVSNGRWLAVDVEASLFPEKAEEQHRNRRLLAALAGADSALARLREELPWQRLFTSWRSQRSVEPHALGPLLAIRPALLSLLAVDNRRGLYSGDYHLLQRRELLLGGRLRELETLHHASLDPGPEVLSAGAPAVYSRLSQLLLELAAVLDVEVLRGLIGAEAVLRLHRQGAAAALRSQPQEVDPLALLLAEEDFAMFVRLLYGEVAKRSSIARETGALAPPPAADSEARPAATAGRRRATAAPGRRDPQEARRLEAALTAVLSRLTSADYDRWRAFQMVHKLNARLQVLPPTLFAEIHPFLSVLQSDLLPLVEEASAFGLLPVHTAETLRSSGRRLAELDPSNLEHRRDMGQDLGRVVRLLASLTVVVNSGGA